MKLQVNAQIKCAILFSLFALGHPSRRKGELLEQTHKDNWSGKWFPVNPSATNTNPSEEQVSANTLVCDDGIHNLAIDFLPNAKQHNFNYLCITANQSAFKPNLQTQALLTEYYIPPAYEPRSTCLSTPLIYEYTIPTYGAFRPLPPKYGEYKYLPPQRWVRSLAEGAIVMLYHPCADDSQRELLKKLINACLYRHIITPSTLLTSEYPLALIAWGKLLQMSVVDAHIVMDFIKQNAKHAPFSASIDSDLQITHYYEHLLLQEAHLITTVEDTQLCGFNIHEM